MARLSKLPAWARSALASLALWAAVMAVVGSVWRLTLHGLPTALLAAMSVLMVGGAAFFDDKRRYAVRVAAATLLLLSPLLIDVLLSLAAVRDTSYLYRTIAFVGTAVALANTGGGYLGQLHRPLQLLVGLPLLLLALTFWGYYCTSHAWFNADCLLAIAQTTPAEAWAYLQATVPLWLAALALGLLAAAIVALWRCEPLTPRPLTRRAACWLLLFVALGGYTLVRARHNIYTQPCFQMRSVLHEYEAFAAQKSARQAHIAAMLPTLTGVGKTSGVYVLVIGESHSRLHMSAYGYDRPTTPWLDSLKGDPRAVIFTRARSCHTHTVPCLNYALTAKNQYNDVKLEDALSLLEMAEAAGMRTAWLSNQGKYGIYDTPVSVMGTTAEQQAWTNQGGLGLNSFDERLLPELERLSLSPDMLIVVHLMGSHVTYDERYPAEYGRFSTFERAGLYDNSVLYNDDVMRRIVARAGAMPNFKALVYFSDHSEDVDNGFSHDANKYTPAMTKIPMYAVFSPSYMAERPETVAALRAHKDAPFTNDLVYNLVLSLMGIRPPEHEPQNDFAGAGYDATPSRFRTLHGKRGIE